MVSLTICSCNVLGTLLGLGIATLLTSLFTGYNVSLHEAWLWFSEIGPLEREISLRTESGLYYSFYKQMVEWKGKEREEEKGIQNLLVKDQLTEWPRKINVLQRFNIFLEVSVRVV